MEFSQFLQAVEPHHQGFVDAIREELFARGYRCKIELKATGLFASYSHPKTKRSLLNIFFRKTGMKFRVYPSVVSADIIKNLPTSMEKEIEKAMPCKRLLNSADCNPKCIMGYSFDLQGTRQIKCRYNCFEFSVTEESKPIIAKWIMEELDNER